MSAVATERWSDRGLKKTPGGWEATRAWDVVGAADELAAITATGVDINSPHPLSTYLLAMQPDAKAAGFQVWRVTTQYQTPVSGSFTTTGESPLAKPPIIRWRTGRSSEPTDTDIYGNPVLNSAGDAFNSAPSKDYISRFLSVIRYEPYYDINKANKFENTICSDSPTFMGLKFSPGQVMCLTIQPNADYEQNAPYVTIAYDFEIRTPLAPNLTTLQKRHPFQWRFQDVGTRAKYMPPSGTNATSTGKPVWGEFFDNYGEKLSKEVLLDGSGRPIDTSIRCSSKLIAPQQQTLAKNVLVDKGTSTATPAGVSSPAGGTKAVFLIQFRYFEVKFAGVL